MLQTNRTIVRNEAMRRGNLGDRYRHNERRNQNYSNGDVVPERSHLNVHFRQCEGTYTEAFDKLVEDGAISTRGLGKDPKIVDEMVFDVNSAYFEEKGGYDYAKDFYAEAYRMAVQEAGGEQYILSAVMHADERNKALSEQLDWDVYHYHLHVVYVPVVDKEIKWSKRCKDKSLVGTVKEVIKQVSHSKKWPRQDTEDGWVNSYSLLQDRFYRHMVEAGFSGFERGERGSTAQHLSVLDYKMGKDEERAAFLAQTIRQKERRLEGLDKKLAVAQKSAHTYGEIQGMGRKGKTGKILVEPEDWQRVCALCKEAIASRGIIPDLKNRLERKERDANIYRQRWESVSADTEDYRKAAQIDRQQVQAALEAIVQNGAKTAPIFLHSSQSRQHSR